MAFTIMAACFFSTAVQGQCDPPDLVGVPDGVVIEESYVKTSTTQTLFPSTKSVENFSDLDHAMTKERTLIEKFFHGKDAQGNTITVREVLNPSSYFPEAVYPYTHAVIHNAVGNIYNGSSLIYSFDAPLPNLEQPDLENESEVHRIESEMNINWDDNGLISFQNGDTKVILDTLNDNKISTRYNEFGEIDMVHFVQNDPADRKRIAPIYEVRLEKTQFTDTDGDCTYELTEEIYSNYCRLDTVFNDEQIAEFRSASSMHRPDVNIHVYPNPASDQVRVDLSQDKDQVGGLISVEILNAGGQVVGAEYSSTSTGVVIQTSQLSTGLYIVRLRTEAKTFISKFLKL